MVIQSFIEFSTINDNNISNAFSPKEISSLGSIIQSRPINLIFSMTVGSMLNWKIVETNQPGVNGFDNVKSQKKPPLSVWLYLSITSRDKRYLRPNIWGDGES